ncbi:MAG: tetratricopeptide repeat protein [Oscillospiraceae bacterium]|nr:tetratricopeptide repeat protein [Oscillospiraceae bacterium]
MAGKTIPPEDYLEPRCLLCNEEPGAAQIRSIPQRRVIEKLDEYMSRRDYAGAERHLLYWLSEAELGHDLRGRLLVCNELVGHYRKTREKEKAFSFAEQALELLKTQKMEDSVSAGTTFVNAATAYSAFGENLRALELFRKAKEIYESHPQTRAELLGGLYNNMALDCVALGKFAEAYALYDRAMEIMQSVPGGKLEQAITCLNRADAVTAEKGFEEAEKQVFALVDRAYELLKQADAPHDGYYAFVCEKCAPGFSYYGYFAAAEELKKEAERIYAGN